MQDAMWLGAEHELLLQIIESPDDDGLRLVLADRLIDRGEPLGELISVQLTLEQMLAGRATADWRALKAREAELVKANGARWHQQAAPFARRLFVQRGLPHTLRTSAAALLDDGGLTVVAPIEALELEHVDATQLKRLFALPLLQRVRSLSLFALTGLTSLPFAPGRLPRNVGRLLLELDSAAAFDVAVQLGLLDEVKELVLSLRVLPPGGLPVLGPSVAPRLSRLELIEQGPRLRYHSDAAWLPGLRALLKGRPAVTLEWRGIEYDETNLDTLLVSFEPDTLSELAPLGAEHYNREPYSEPGPTLLVPRASPRRVDVERSSNGTWVARAPVRGGLTDLAQPLAVDAVTQLVLEPHPGRLNARAYQQSGFLLSLQYEPFPSRTLHELGLPLPLPAALEVVHSLARVLPVTRLELLRQGLLGWPDALSLDDVLLGSDGAVKLMPPFRNSLLVEDESEPRHLGLPLDADLEGTDDGIRVLLGSALMHLLAGVPCDRALRPSALNPDWQGADAFVEGCLTRSRARAFPSSGALLEALEQHPLKGNADSVAQQVRLKQS